MSVTGYELTERGKIVIACVIVVVLLVLSAFLMGRAFADRSDPQESAAATEQPVSSNNDPPVSQDAPDEHTPADISESPLPDGGDFSHSGGTAAPPSQDYAASSAQPSVSPTGSSPTDTQNPPDNTDMTRPGINPAENSYTFYLYPAEQIVLSERDISRIREFCASPDNTQNSLIALETPQLPDAVLSNLMDVLEKEFSDNGVDTQRITHIIHPAEDSGDVVTVRLYYYFTLSAK